MTVTVERRSMSCGRGAYELPNGRLGPIWQLDIGMEAATAVHRVRERYTIFVVLQDGRWVDSFLKKSNANRLARRLANGA